MPQPRSQCLPTKRTSVHQIATSPGSPNVLRPQRIPVQASLGKRLGEPHWFYLLNDIAIRWVQDLQSGLQSLRLDAQGEAHLDFQEFSPGWLKIENPPVHLINLINHDSLQGSQVLSASLCRVAVATGTQAWLPLTSSPTWTPATSTLVGSTAAPTLTAQSLRRTSLQSFGR